MENKVPKNDKINMKKLMLLGLLVLFSINVTFAQRTKPKRSTRTTRSVQKSDPKAVAILDKVNKKYAAYKSMQIELTLTIQDGAYKEVQKGKVTVKGNKFKIESRDQEIVSDGKTNWVYLKNNGDLQISNPEPDDMPIFSSPDKLLKSYEKDFISGLIGEFKEGNRMIYRIEFKPKSRRSEYSKVRVTIDKKTKSILKIKVFEKNNTHYTIKVTRLVKNVTLKDSFFKFDARKRGIKEDKIIDLREG